MVAGLYTLTVTFNFPGLPAVFPDVLAPVVHTAPDGERELSMMRWGFPPPPNLGEVPVTNVRNVKSPYWRGWLKAEWRCLVPATSFCEWTDSRPKVTHWFAPDEGRPLFAFAGIRRLWTGERKGETGAHRLFTEPKLHLAPSSFIRGRQGSWEEPGSKRTSEDNAEWHSSSPGEPRSGTEVPRQLAQIASRLSNVAK
jgi:hypothetical protein